MSLQTANNLLLKSNLLSNSDLFVASDLFAKSDLLVTPGGAPTTVPVIVTLPAITGVLQQGQTVFCSTGTWTESPTSFSYQWTRNGVDISGASASSYVPVFADVGTTLDCNVIATNIIGPSLPATATGGGIVIIAAPTNSVLPTITGTFIQGTVQTCSTGTWTGSPTFAYQWVLGAYPGTPIGGAASSTYTPTSGQVGQTLGCVVTATNAGGFLAENASGANTITSGTSTVALQFNLASNSMYIPLISPRDQATVTSPSIPLAA